MRFVTPDPNRRRGFSNHNRETRNPYPNHGREGGFPNPHEYKMKVDIPSFSENLDIKSFLNWIYEEDKFFDMAYVPWRNKSNL